MSVTVVYRSAADMNRAEFWYEEGPKMQERAIKAEAKVERLERVLSTSKVVVGFRGCHDENSAWSIRALESAIKRYELEEEDE